MRKISGVHISEHPGHKELSLENETAMFLNPDYVYIPLVEQNTPCTALVTVGQTVKLGEVVAEKGGRFSIPIHATVSGTIESIDKKMWHGSGKMVPCIVIKNDFKETKVDSIKKNDVNSLSRQDIIRIMKDCGLVGLGGSGFPMYAKYQTDAPIDVIIANGAECEPYINNDYVLMQSDVAYVDFFDKLMRGIDYAMKAADASRAVIAIKKYKVHLITHIKEMIKDKPYITICELKDEYPAGWEKYLVHLITKKTYKNLPSEAGAIVNNIGTIVSLCEAVEENKPLIEKVITVTGKCVKDPCTMYTKIGTLVSDIIAHQGGYIDNLDRANTYLIAGGPMTGKSIMFDNIVVHRSFSDVIVMEKSLNEDNPHCMGCGKCADHCPQFLSPILIKNAFDAKDLKLLNDYNATKCMQCGLCSYICPSRIELTEAVGKAKALLMKK